MLDPCLHFGAPKKWAHNADHLQVQFDVLAPEDTWACPDPSQDEDTEDNRPIAYYTLEPI